MKQTIRNTLITVISLIVLFIGAGIAYVWLSGRTPAKQPQPKTATIQPPSAPKPSQPGPNAVEQASVQSLLSPVKAGDNSSLSVKTNATSTCTVSVTYNNIPSKDSGLSPKIADAYGN